MSAPAENRGDQVTPVFFLQPPQGWSALSIRELWTSRDLLYFLALRDITVRYSQALMGIAWAVIQPLMMMALFSIFLGRFARIPSDAIPYPVFVYAGLAPWIFFANSVSNSSDSLVTSSNLVSKVYFPRLLVPLAAILSWIPDLLISLILVTAFMLVYGLTPGWTGLLLPGFVVFALLAASSISVWLSALNVAYRDVRYAVPFFLQAGLFTTSVLYPPTLVPAQFRPLLGLNPMTGVVQGVRWSLLGGRPPWGLMGISAGVTVILLVTGLYYFRRVEHFFADLI